MLVVQPLEMQMLVVQPLDLQPSTSGDEVELGPPRGSRPGARARQPPDQRGSPSNTQGRARVTTSATAPP
jgi:hypothetical protein